MRHWYELRHWSDNKVTGKQNAGNDAWKRREKFKKGGIGKTADFPKLQASILTFNLIVQNTTS